MHLHLYCYCCSGVVMDQSRRSMDRCQQVRQGRTLVRLPDCLPKTEIAESFNQHQLVMPGEGPPEDLAVNLRAC